ncbi:MAG: dienelactone hydrolase family protein [Firmicutes bacterium]|nr:dienelactone hydrolase family protein [Bacillota bacterium]
MNILELILYIVACTMIGTLLVRRTTKKKHVFILLSYAVLFFLAHLIFSEIRWQLFLFYPLYVSLGVIVYLKKVRNIDVKNIIRKSVTVLLILFSVVFIGILLVFPMYEIPKPSGDYLIGTESFIIEDENRDELYTEDLNDIRRIKIQLWYPAESIDGYNQLPWLEDGVVVARALSKDIGLPLFVLDHTANIMSNSYYQAPVSNALDSYPVVIISHGWRGFKNLHTDFAEELASIGYVVVAIDHTYGSVATVFDSDDVAYLNLDALPERETTSDFLVYSNQLVNTYAADITTTIDYIEGLNNGSSSSKFSGRLDLTKIGLLGHSTGGGADVAVALNDIRIDALIGLDAWVEPIYAEEIDKGLSIPSLFIRSETWETGVNNITLNTLIENSNETSLLYQIDGTTHFDFTMVYMYSPLTKYIGFSGSVEGRYLTSILKTMITSFFNETLRDEENSEIDADLWEEVRLIP